MSKELEKTWQLLMPEQRPGHYEVAYMMRMDDGNAYLRIYIRPKFAAEAKIAPGDWLSLHHDGHSTLQLRKGGRCEATRKLHAPKRQGRLLYWEIRSSGAVAAIFGQERTSVQRMERVGVGDGMMMFQYYTGEEGSADE